MKQRRIVIVEDEPSILEVMSYNLRREGYSVIIASDGEVGISTIRKEIPDLVLLDIMLPGMDGIEVCQKLKADATLKSIPIVMVTAKAEESDIVLGLGVGADDYIAKPFSPRELVARVKAALRRSPLRADQDSNTLIETTGLRIDTVKHEVTYNEEKMDFTPSEFSLLHTLASSPGRVYTRDELISTLGSGEALVIERNIDTHVKAIRRKLGEGSGLVETVRGVGYRFREGDV